MNQYSIEQFLQTMLRLIRRTQRSRAVMIVATVTLLGLLLIMLVDYAYSPLPVAVRMTLFVAWIIAIFAAFQKGLAPLFREISMVQLARWIEMRHPEMQERLSTCLELRGKEGEESAGLLAELHKAALADANAIDARCEVKSVSTVYRWQRPLIALVVLLTILLILAPRQSGRLFLRAISPFSKLGNTGAITFTITPGDIELVEGDSLNINIDYQGDESTLELITERGGGEALKEILSGENGKFTYKLNPVVQGFRYHLRAGKNESDRYSVTVWPRPTLVDNKLTLRPPDYLGLPAEITTLIDQISVVSGTRFQLVCKTNTSIESACIEAAGETLATASVTSASGSSQLDFAWTMDQVGSSAARLLLKHRLGEENVGQTFTIEVIQDASPRVVLLAPSQRELRLRNDEMINLRYDVIEDFALSLVALEVNDYVNESLTIPEELPLRVQDTKPTRYRGSDTISMGALISKIGGKRDFQIRIKAQDGKPTEQSGPGIGYSEWIKITIDDHAETLARQELRQEHEGAFEKIDKTIQEVREARDKIDQHREEVKKAESSENTQKELTEAAEKLVKAQQDTRELAQQMQESVHAPLAELLTQAAEKIQRSREDMENAPLQDGEALREQKMDEARITAEESILELEELKQKMNQQNEQIQDLARLQDLAQKQQESARKAEGLAQQPPTDDSKDQQQSWQQQQDQLKYQIRQELQEQPQALAEALRQQAEQAKQLAADATAMAQSQQQLQERALTPDNLEDALASLQNSMAQKAQALSEAIAAVPQPRDSGNLQHAEQTSGEGAQHAQRAFDNAQLGKQEQASNEHQQAHNSFERSAQALNHAAEEFSQAAEQAAHQQTSPHQAPAAPQALVEAFQLASRASENSQLPQAAQQAAQAATALDQAARSARAGLQGKHQALTPNPPAPHSNAPSSLETSLPEANAGVPPQLAKLGISLADWEKIQSSLNSDIGGNEVNSIPEEYRNLVKEYFKTISQKE